MGVSLGLLVVVTVFDAKWGAIAAPIMRVLNVGPFAGLGVRKYPETSRRFGVQASPEKPHSSS